MKTTAVIAAGGRGERMDAGKNKVLMEIRGHAMLFYTISAFQQCGGIDEIVIVTAPRDIEECKKIAEGFDKVSTVTEGGSTRQLSVMAGLRQSRGDIVLIHDGARALITEAEIKRVLADCIKYGAAAVGVPCKDTLKTADKDGFICGTVDRDSTYLIQTPQAFGREEIYALHERAVRDGFEATDDCMIAEHYGMRVRITRGSYDNIKLTTPEDIAVAEQILKKRCKEN